jgi:hypothetical protein
MIGLLILMGVVALAIFLDIVILKNTITEWSFTEFCQEIILLLIIIRFIWLSLRRPAFKYGMILIAGFFACLFFRELDFITDRIALSWFDIDLVIVFLGLFLAVRHRENTLAGWHHFRKSQSYRAMVWGLILLLGFSRLIGMKIVWKYILGPSYLRVVKNAVEEGSELLGYTLCLFSAFKYAGPCNRAKPALSIKHPAVIKTRPFSGR